MIMDALWAMLLGMAGIFAVMSVIITSVWILNRLGKGKRGGDNPE